MIIKGELLNEKSVNDVIYLFFSLGPFGIFSAFGFISEISVSFM